jgi:hypothetical protein
MRLLFGLFTLLFLTSCDTTTTPKEQKPELKVEKFVNEFIGKHPDWNKNDIIQKNINDTFRKEISTRLQNNLLDDFPLELDEINEYQKGKYAAEFSSFYTKNVDYNSVLYNMHFDIIGLINDSLVQKLEKDKKYLVKGHFKKFLQGDFKNYINGMVYTPQVGLSSDVISKNLETDLGILLFDVKEVKETSSL